MDKYLSFLVALKCNIHPVPWSPQQDRGSAASSHKLPLCWLPPLPSFRGSTRLCSPHGVTAITVSGWMLGRTKSTTRTTANVTNSPCCDSDLSSNPGLPPAPQDLGQAVQVSEPPLPIFKMHNMTAAALWVSSKTWYVLQAVCLAWTLAYRPCSVNVSCKYYSQVMWGSFLGERATKVTRSSSGLRLCSRHLEIHNDF